jgi:phosphomannomutase
VAASSCLTVALAFGVAACGSSDNKSSGGSGSTGSTSLTIYSSLPLQGDSRPQSESVVNGEKLALQEHGGKVGKFTIKYVSLDDSTAATGKWEPGATSSDARKAAQDKSTIAYLGEFNSGASAISIPIINEAGILQISPSNTYVGLTRSEGADKGEPDKYYPSGKRTYGRVVPADHIQAAAQVAFQKDQGCKKVYILNDKEVYGKGIADAVQKDGTAQGLQVLGNDGIDTKAANFRSLATKIKSSGADCLFFGGIVQNKGVQLFSDVNAANPTLKLFGPGGTFLAPAQSDEVARRAAGGAPAWVTHERVGSAREDDEAIERHRDAILALPGFDRARIAARRFRAAVDGVNGAGSLATPALLRALGCDVETLYCVPDGRFPRVAEPLPENLGALGELVRRTGAAIGFAHDPDADRLAIVDERGEPIGEERTLQIAIDWALRRNPGLVAVNTSTSMGVDLIARRYGVRVLRTRVGEAHVAQALLEHGGVIGGEGNGGVIFPALHATRDGLLAAAIALDWLAESDLSLSQRVAELPPLCMVKRKLDLRIADKTALGEALRAAFPDGERNVLDGEKYVWEDGWVQVRASGTEPIVRIIAEAARRDRAEELTSRASAAVERSQSAARAAS